jgi:hypothetical protein
MYVRGLREMTIEICLSFFLKKIKIRKCCQVYSHHEPDCRTNGHPPTSNSISLIKTDEYRQRKGKHKTIFSEIPNHSRDRAGDLSHVFCSIAATWWVISKTNATLSELGGGQTLVTATLYCPERAVQYVNFPNWPRILNKVENQKKKETKSWTIQQLASIRRQREWSTPPFLQITFPLLAEKRYKSDKLF